MRLTTYLVILWCAALQAQNFTFKAEYGSHAAGWRVVHQYDFSRVYAHKFDAAGQAKPGERARPIQTVIWYPAQPAAGAKPTVFGDYMALGATEETFDPSEQQKAAALKRSQGTRTDAEFHRLRSEPMKAIRDARPEPGKFPVVVYAPSFSAPPTENADLCEYLATHGYLVVASPDMGAHSRGMTGDLEGIEAQVGDIEFLIGYVQHMPEADTSRIAVVGFSWGGISNVFARMKDDRISAVASLDGSVRYFPGLVKEAKYVKPDRMEIPFLYLSQHNPPIEMLVANKFDMSASVLNDLKYTDLYHVNFDGMQHQDFASSFIRTRPPANFTDYSPEEISESYSWMARYVLNFLNANLNGDAAAAQFLKNDPDKNNVPRHLLTITRKQGQHPAPSLDALAHALAEKGFDKAATVYAEWKKVEPGFELAENVVNGWGYELMTAGKVREAIGVFQMNVTLHPESSNVYDSLGEAYMNAGDDKQAIANYKKSIELNPENTAGAEQLKKLEAKSKK